MKKGERKNNSQPKKTEANTNKKKQKEKKSPKVAVTSISDLQLIQVAEEKPQQYISVLVFNPISGNPFSSHLLSFFSDSIGFVDLAVRPTFIRSPSPPSHLNKPPVANRPPGACEIVCGNGLSECCTSYNLAHQIHTPIHGDVHQQQQQSEKKTTIATTTAHKSNTKLEETCTGQKKKKNTYPSSIKKA